MGLKVRPFTLGTRSDDALIGIPNLKICSIGRVFPKEREHTWVRWIPTGLYGRRFSSSGRHREALGNAQEGKVTPQLVPDKCSIGYEARSVSEIMGIILQDLI